MSAPRAMKPLLGAGSRLLLVDQLVLPRSNFVIARPSRAPIPSSSSLSSTICMGCGFASRRIQQLRSYSNSSSKPPNDDKHGPPPFEMPKFDEPASHSDPPRPPPPPPPPFPEGVDFDINTNANTNANTNTTSAQEQHPPSHPEESSSSSSSSSTSSTATSNHDLPSAQNSRRSSLNKSLSGFMDRAQTTFFAASRRLNDLTGYSGIEALKREVGSLEDQLRAAQGALHGARAAYKAAVSSRSATQREVTTLLARQKTWTPADFERFTQLYRADYELEARVADTAAALEEAEQRAERLGRDLSARILARYHEEQIWSDKIRRMSTWGTWGLMGVNVLLFLVFQFGAEPWRRRRLVRGFEAKVREALEEERERDRALKAREDEVEEWWSAVAAAEEAERATAAAEASAAAAATQEAIPAPPADEIPGAGTGLFDDYSEPGPEPISWRDFLADPQGWGPALRALYDRKAAQAAVLCSERRVTVRARDLTVIALEGAAAGALVVGGAVAVIFLRR